MQNRVRKLCLSLPGASEKLSHGEPTFFVRKKVFAMLSDNHHNDGHVAIMIPLEPGEQAALIAANPRTYYYPKYVGVKGWVGIELDQIDDEDLAVHLHQAHRLVSQKR